MLGAHHQEEIAHTKQLPSLYVRTFSLLWKLKFKTVKEREQLMNNWVNEFHIAVVNFTSFSEMLW